jgi:dipeptidyl-peptidase-4
MNHAHAAASRSLGLRPIRVHESRARALVVAFALFAPPALAQQKELTFADLAAGVRFTTPLPPVAFVDGGRVLQVGRGEGATYHDPATGAAVPAPAESESSEGAARAPRVRVSGGSELVLEDADGVKRTLLSGARGLQLATLAPGGAHASVVAGSDLLIVPTAPAAGDAEGAGDAVWTIGTGDPDLLHGVLDWVYQEEVYGRGDFNAHWWSPDGAHVAFLVIAEHAVPSFTVIDHVPEKAREVERGVVVETTRYPKAGDPNPVTELWVAHPATRALVRVDLSGQPEGFLVVRVGWTPAGDRVVVTVQDRIQQRAELLLADPATGAVQSLIVEQSSTWVERPSEPRWLADGSFLWESDRTGYRHLYHYDLGGQLREVVTAGDWKVADVVRVDETAGRIWFMGTKDGALGLNLYSTDLGPADDVRRWTKDPGSHRVEFDAAGNAFVDRFSSIEAPARQLLVSATTGETLLDLGAATLADTHLFLPPRRLTIETRDGYPLDALVVLPREGHHEGPRPVFVDTYSGPDAPTVSDTFRASAWLQFLAQRGAIVLQVNVRSASGRGHAHTATCYRQLGVQELKDLEDAVDHVVATFGGDASKVAISGWSYGGFIAAYALTNSDRFSLGLAGAGVYDWRLYDTIYTERYMATPQENEAGYRATSVIENAANLRGHLVLMHGTMDDNVHLQNTIQLADALQRAGKLNFDMMLYANSRHGVGSRHLQAYQWRMVQQHLGLSE